jgi:hypothetical protein
MQKGDFQSCGIWLLGDWSCPVTDVCVELELWFIENSL